eukprot:GDKK01067839.1.p2 GENE.GDKK01067839.1~~GDKK01067839.1.p2  ORF type:complete len:151 (-),score=11.83 GDKK01067839.1:337-789(-)
MLSAVDDSSGATSESSGTRTGVVGTIGTVSLLPGVSRCTVTASVRGEVIAGDSDGGSVGTVGKLCSVGVGGTVSGSVGGSASVVGDSGRVDGTASCSVGGNVDEGNVHNSGEVGVDSDVSAGMHIGSGVQLVGGAEVGGDSFGADAGGGS